MLALAGERSARRYSTMEKRTSVTPQAAMGEAIRRLRDRSGYTQEKAAELASVVELSWRRYEKGERDLSLAKASALVGAIGFSQEDLLRTLAEVQGAPNDALASNEGGAGKLRSAGTPRPTATELPIRDRVQAGAWLLADDLLMPEPRMYPATPDPRYARASQWLSEVLGDSMNKLNIFEGDLVKVVDAIDIGYHPRSGDIVEVERLRRGGSERELTIKQVELGTDGWELWPRSTNTYWRDPIVILAGVGETEEVEVRIRGLVVGLERRFS